MQSSQAQSLAPAALTIQRPEGRVVAGDVIRLSFHVGSAAQPITDLFGLSFELQYSTKQFMQPLSPEQVIAGSFLEPNTYTFARHEVARSTVALAVSRKLGATGRSGFGEVLSYSFAILPETPEGTEFCFAVQNISANDSTGKALPLVAGPPMCVKIAEHAIVVGPNPFTPNEDGSNDQVEFKREGGIPSDWTISIMDRTGRVVRRLREGAHRWDGRDEQQRAVLPDVYLYVIQNGEVVITRGVLGLVR